VARSPRELCARVANGTCVPFMADTQREVRLEAHERLRFRVMSDDKPPVVRARWPASKELAVAVDRTADVKRQPGRVTIRADRGSIVITLENRGLEPVTVALAIEAFEIPD
jgi:hypothetical protein